MDIFLIAETMLALITICSGFATVCLIVERRGTVTSEQIADRVVLGIHTLIQSERIAVRTIINSASF